MDKGINMEDRTNCKKILIVDDEEAIQRILGRIVKKVGRGVRDGSKCGRGPLPPEGRGIGSYLL
jgi:Flp pilus assembly CpaF family ATPase